jgi:DNA-binding SARP family transcriptional activator
MLAGHCLQKDAIAACGEQGDVDARCRIEMLGGLRVRQGERVITRFRAHKYGALLAYLAYYLRQQHPREVLVELFWPELEPEAQRNNLSLALSSLRRQLEPPGVPSGAVIVADRFSVGLNPEAVATDVVGFEAALRDADQADDGQAQEQRLARAVALYRGPLLPGYYEEWVLPEQARLAERYLQALGRLIEWA